MSSFQFAYPLLLLAYVLAQVADLDAEIVCFRPAMLYGVSRAPPSSLPEQTRAAVVDQAAMERCWGRNLVG